MPSPYIYVNAELPKRFTPPKIEKKTVANAEALNALLLGNDIIVTAASNGTTQERILSIFEDPEVLFGDPSFIPANRAAWLKKISHFVEAGKPLEFVSMAFPYKSPNPLKTDRKAPDLGEALMLRRFQAVLDAVGAVYAPGARLTILEEGILGRCQGVPPEDIAAYRAGIAASVAVAGVDPQRVTFHSLDTMVSDIPNFEARWIHEQERLRELHAQGEAGIVDAYATTVKASRTSVPTQDYEPELLAAAYDPDQTESALRYVRDYIEKVAHRQVFAYRAIINLRDSTGYLHNLRPNALKLTVSPKPENLAVTPVNTWSKILPYHGVPVLGADGRWTIRYLGGMENMVLEALHLDGEADPAPIGYRVLG
ncbi:L-tyrosine/L-tryptophan isonitrile synthase family protein [Martelella sp. HB161492]|uniref:L-tyrosine/L-tryptophan isonitrile synthase family protein n=1 Tax=Martelella sp. HB161492 TaxID=2720726 RepID=UPI00159225E3|nr:L-tyrosine/L-tryptophan isonitrile synthase family protein [Martelella sp. HB161492]